MYIPFKKCIDLSGPINAVIHIGGNRGEEINAYQTCGVKKIIWVEGNSENIPYLVEKTLRPNIEQKYYNVVLTDENKELTFNIANNMHSSSILEFGTHKKMYPKIKWTRHEVVQAKTFKTLAKEENININEYDFLNLDVQGAELMVLKGFGDLLNAKSIKGIYTEVNIEEVYENCCRIEELDEFLGNFGFIRKITKMPERTWGDAYYSRAL